MASNREKAMELLRELISKTKDHPELFEFMKTQLQSQLKSMIGEAMDPDPAGGYVVDFFDKRFNGTSAEDLAHQILSSELKELR